MRRSYAIAALLLVICATSVWSAPLVRTLANGARLVVEENHSAPAVAVRFYIGAGSALEGRFLGAGITHFVEHCAGGGTATLTKEQIARIGEELGNDQNAFTSKRMTCYYINTAPENAGRAISLLGSYVLGATFPAEEVEIQRGIILREIARGDDDARRLISSLFDETMFLTHPERYRIIGYPAAFSALTREDLVAYHRELYTPDNLVAVVVGAVPAGETMAQLEAALAAYPRRAAIIPTLPTEPAPTGIRRRTMQREGFQRAYLALGFRSVGLFDDDMYPLDIAAYVLGNGVTSRLVRTIRDQMGLVDSIYAYSDTPDYGAGSFVVGAVLDPARLDEVETAILAELERLRTEPITAAELERAKKQKQAELAFAAETAEGRASQLGVDMLLTGDIEFSQRYVERIGKVSAEQVMDAAQRYFDPQRRVVCVLRPPTEIAQDGVGRGPVEPETLTATLANGLRVIIRAVPEAPTAHIVAAAEAGLRCETSDTSGITNMMAAMLRRGTTNRSREQIADAFESVGGSFGGFAGRNSFGLTAAVLPADLDTALDVLADCLRNPSFPAEEFERQRLLALAAIAAKRDNVDAFAADRLREALFSVHPYRLDELGTPESVSALTPERVRAYYGQVCRPERMTLVVIGGVDAAKTLARVRGLFEDWRPPSAAPLPAPLPEPSLTEQRLVQAQRPQQQALILYGFQGSKVTDENRYIQDVMSAVFAGAGIPGGRLHRELRDRSLVYATFGYPVRGLDPGFYAIYAATPPESVAETRSAIEELIAGLRAAPPSAEELERAKNMAITAHDMGLTDPGALAQSMALNELYGLGYNEYAVYAERVRAVTAEQTQQEAIRLLDLRRCVVVVTTPAPATEPPEQDAG